MDNLKECEEGHNTWIIFITASVTATKMTYIDNQIHLRKYS